MDNIQYQKENAAPQYPHHYWEYPIAIYLFLGGLGGGIMFLCWIMQAFVFPGVDLSQAFMAPMFIGLLCIAVGLFFLVFELGQPPVFYRAYVTATSIIKWGAVLLSFAAFFSLFYVLGYWAPESPVLGFLSVFNGIFGPFNGINLAISGIAGFGIMIYTGIMLSSLKAHSFWATPALPILFTTSALSTACAGIMLSLCVWPGVPSIATMEAAHSVHGILHLVDIILVFTEITILFVMILSFLGAGNRTQQRVAKRWIKGEYAGWFWIGMFLCGLLIPLCLNISGLELAGTIACVLVLCGGLLLRFLCVWSDDRQPLAGENRYYKRLQTDDTRIFTVWYKTGKEMGRGETIVPRENLY